MMGLYLSVYNECKTVTQWQPIPMLLYVELNFGPMKQHCRRCYNI